MLKFCSVFVVLLAVCYAQPTPAPKLEIPETFEAMFDLGLRSHGEERGGTGEWWRSQELEDSLRKDTIKNATGTMTFEHLSLYREHVEYNIEGTHCEKREIPEDFKFPMIWMEFEEHAHFAGKRTEKIGNMSVEVYVWEMGPPPGRDGERTELWAKVVPEGESVKEPFAMAKMDHRGSEAMIFTSFMPTSPPSTGFDPPSECKMATTSPKRPQKPRGH